ncbi:hypothetical protein [Fibrobacter sp. UWB12]|uniref:hypothetical protein n=1 Tax=Fibrobacter sp. UWB12 TaxID=1896203 RepID=UPI00091A1620|nr:hypothetical protein [Fibrobacter sp. UWB12]SHK42342.1 hypothetical protein SAMN05720759_102414 [Fibrobacter sp. UWB12]
MLGKIINLSAFALLLGVVACDKKTSGITEEGNSVTAYDLWNGADGAGGFKYANVAARWYSVDDENDGGTSSIVFPTIEGNNLTSENMESLVSYCGGLCGTVELGESSAPSAGVGIALTENDSAIDISEWDGLCVSYESALQMKGVLGYKDGSTLSANDMPTVEFDKTENGTYASRCAKWADFRQSSPNNNSGVEASKKATSLIFKFVGKAKESGFFNIKGVSSYKHGVQNLDSIEYVEPMKVDTSACLWNGTLDNPGSMVMNDLDGTRGGLWYSYNDRNDGGASLLYWSAEAPNYKNAFEWLADDELFKGGLSASVSLDKGNAPQAYAGIGFRMAVRDSANADYSAKATDISGWGGICVYYMAEKDMRMVLASDSLEKDYTLAASTTPVEKCITWDEMSTAGLEKSASDIKFEVRSSENVFNQIRFNIIAVGKYKEGGACIADESKVNPFS